MRKCNWQLEYPKEQPRCDEPATEEVFELDGKTHQGWLCLKHAKEWDRFRMSTNAQIGAEFVSRN